MTSPAVYLIGGGDHGRVLLEALLLQGVPVAGILDPGLTIGDHIFGVAVCSDAVILNVPRHLTRLVNGVGGRNDNTRRNEIYGRYLEQGFQFAGVTHPSVVIGRDCTIHESAQFLASVVIQQRVEIGENSVVNTSSVVEHDSRVGANCFLGPRVTLSGRVEICDSAFVGAGAVVLPGIRVGAAARVGAGAVVTRDVEPNRTVVGNPARAL